MTCVGRRSREWTAEAPSELECVYELARCLRIIGESGRPEVEMVTDWSHTARN